MSKTIRAIAILLVAIMVLSIGTTCFAANNAKEKLQGISNSADNSNVDTNTVENMGGKIIRITRIIAYIVTLVVLAVLAIKYIMGSAEQKAEYKKSFIPFIVGLIILSGGVTIVGWILDNFGSF